MIQYFREKILQSENKLIPFYEYMVDCLYHEKHGYYIKEQQKIGKKGDFITTSSVHSVFAEIFVQIVAEIFHKNPGKEMIFCEMGAGTGIFAKQFLDHLQLKHPQIYSCFKYLLIEKSPFHQEQQKIMLENHTERIQWKDSIELIRGFKGVFFSNELVDSFPVHIIEKRNGQLMELGVTWSEEEQKLKEVLFPLTNQAILYYLDQNQLSVSEGQRIEIPLDSIQWASDAAEAIEEGIWFTVDYGYTNQELMLPQYRKGSLLCYYQHQVDDNPYDRPGEKDITSHIHFDPLINEASAAGWIPLNLAKQNEFLLNAGIIHLLQEHQGGDPFLNETIRRNRAIQYLISSEGMSASFHVLTLGKGSFTQDSYSFLQPFSFQKEL